MKLPSFVRFCFFFIVAGSFEGILGSAIEALEYKLADIFRRSSQYPKEQLLAELRAVAQDKSVESILRIEASRMAPSLQGYRRVSTNGVLLDFIRNDDTVEVDIFYREYSTNITEEPLLSLACYCPRRQVPRIDAIGHIQIYGIEIQIISAIISIAALSTVLMSANQDAALIILSLVAWAAILASAIRAYLLARNHL
jgi:hypothetical protein